MVINRLNHHERYTDLVFPHACSKTCTITLCALHRVVCCHGRGQVSWMWLRVSSLCIVPYTYTVEDLLCVCSETCFKQGRDLVTVVSDIRSSSVRTNPKRSWESRPIGCVLCSPVIKTVPCTCLVYGLARRMMWSETEYVAVIAYPKRSTSSD